MTYSQSGGILLGYIGIEVTLKLLNDSTIVLENGNLVKEGDRFSETLDLVRLNPRVRFRDNNGNIIIWNNSSIYLPRRLNLNDYHMLPPVSGFVSLKVYGIVDKIHNAIGNPCIAHIKNVKLNYSDSFLMENPSLLYTGSFEFYDNMSFSEEVILNAIKYGSISWKYLSITQKLSEDFILNNLDSLELKLLKLSHLTDKARKKIKLYIALKE